MCAGGGGGGGGGGHWRDAEVLHHYVRVVVRPTRPYTRSRARLGQLEIRV